MGTLLCCFIMQADRFRDRVVQVAFSTPGVKYPEDGIPDEELMDALKKLIDERTEKQRQITDLKDQIKQLSGQEKKGDKAIRQLKTHLTESLVSHRSSHQSSFQPYNTVATGDLFIDM